jgi:hypothetical protein
VYWQAGDGDWFYINNWLVDGLNEVPGNQSYAYVVNGGTAQISYGSAVSNALEVDIGSEFVLDGTGSLTAGGGGETVGQSGIGIFNQSGGLNNCPGLLLGDNVGSTGSYSLDGAGTLADSGGIIVGLYGTGNFNQTGGTVSLQSISAGLSLGDEINSSGVYNLSGTGSLSVAQIEVIGNAGIGIFNQSGGANSVGSIRIGGGGTLTSTYLLSGNGILQAGGVGVGLSGTGVFNQSGGTNICGGLALGDNTGGTGTYVLSGMGSLVTTGIETIGYDSTGVFEQAGGANDLSGELDIALYNTSYGSYFLSGGSLDVSGGVYLDGSSSYPYGGDGVLSVSNTGLLNVGGTLTLERGALPGSGVTLSGGTINTAALNLNGQPSLFSWTSGTLGLTAGVTFDPGASPTTTSAAFCSSLVLGANQALNVYGDETLGGTQTFALTVGSGSTHSVSGKLVVNAGSTLAVSGGRVTLYGGGIINSASGLSITNGGLVDITNTSLAINFGATANDPITTFVSYLQSGFNAGNWTGTSGIISTTAQTQGGPALSVGYADGNTDPGTAAGANQILVKYTLAGDANLDGLVNFQDLVAVVQNFNKPGTDWAHGNFLYGASTNFQDLVAVVQNFNKILTPAGSSDASDGNATIALGRIDPTAVRVPEPTALALLAAGATGLLAHRRKRSN